MEHELFQSELKPSVDGALISGMIRSSSSGLYSHRAAAIELILERSIQDRRDGAPTRVKNRLWKDPAPQPKSGTPDIFTPQIQSFTPTTTSQLSLRSLPNDTTGVFPSLASAFATYDPSRGSSTFSRPAKGTKKVARRKEPPVDITTSSSLPKATVELACPACDVKQLRRSLQFSLYCGFCQPWQITKCVGCGTSRVGVVDACTGCLGQFK